MLYMDLWTIVLLIFAYKQYIQTCLNVWGNEWILLVCFVPFSRQMIELEK